MDNVLYKIVELAICLVLLIVLYFGKAYLVPFLKTKMTADQYELVKSVVDAAVRAAQQMFWNESGTDRKDYVVATVNRQLEDFGIKITSEQLDNLIESAVKTIKIASGETYPKAEEKA